MVSVLSQITQPDSLINQAGIGGLPSGIANAIKTAAVRTGVDFSYLMQKAAQESGFDPNAKASGSSATGLFQFTNQTWLQMIRNHGADYGLSDYASKITVDSSGAAHVSDPAARKAILALRNDPQISAEMAGELDKQNLDHLQDNVGGKIGGTELYLAHFLGAGGASTFLNQMRSNPSTQAASVLPEAAAANPSVFYNAAGQPRSLSQIYQRFAAKFSGNATAMTASAQMHYTPAQSVASNNATPVTSYSVASAAYGNSRGAGYLASVIGNMKTDTSSDFASMILSQMNAQSLPATQNGDAVESGDKTRKNALSIFAAMA